MTKEAKLIHWWSSPEVIRIQWDTDRVYDYFLDSISDINKFFYIKSKAGINKASAWLNKNSYKTVRINMDKMAQDLTIENFKELLSHPKRKETDPHSKEYVFEYPVIKDSDRIVVKVCSSISKDSGERRAKGKDAIRIFAIDLDAPAEKRGIVKSHRVYRTINWRDNFKKTFTEVFKLAVERVKRRNGKQF